MNKVTAFLAREIRAVVLVTAYFLCWFVIIGFLKSLMLAQYNVSYAGMSGALVGALGDAGLVGLLRSPVPGDDGREGA